MQKNLMIRIEVENATGLSTTDRNTQLGSPSMGMGSSSKPSKLLSESPNTKLRIESPKESEAVAAPTLFNKMQ